jgi:hypothetical protein
LTTAFYRTRPPLTHLWDLQLYFRHLRATPFAIAWILSRVENGTRVRLVHTGFVLAKNATAFKTMSEGWKKVARNLDAIAAQRDSSTPLH